MKHDVCVIGGCGHVGLPLAIALSVRGKRVAVFDTDSTASAAVRNGVMPFLEVDGPEMLGRALASGNLTVADDPSVVTDSRAVVLVVGTPIDTHLAPSFRGIDAVLSQYRSHFRSGQVLILRSTLYPGTSERVARWARDNQLGLHVAVCPERIAQGRALTELFELPQIIASYTPEGLEAAKDLFSVLTQDLVVMEPLEAELAKLYTNAWRYIKFAAANQFFVIAHECGADFDRIYHGMTFHYPRASDLPRPGFSAGPCLFKDTMQLSSYTNNSFFLGHAAMLVNEGLPHYLVGQMRRSYNLRQSTVGILGMAFKADVDDSRDSLSYKLKDLLDMEGGRVLCSDPFIRSSDLVSTETALTESDILVIAVPHTCYRELRSDGKPVVDIWNVLGQGTRL